MPFEPPEMLVNVFPVPDAASPSISPAMFRPASVRSVVPNPDEVTGSSGIGNDGDFCVGSEFDRTQVEFRR